MSKVDVKYVKSNGAKEVSVVIKADEPLNMLDVIRALTNIIAQILNTGKY